MSFVQAKRNAENAVEQASRNNSLSNARMTDKGLAAVASAILALAIAVNESDGRN